MSDSATPRTAGCQALLSFTISQSLFELTFIELMMPTISASVAPFSSCPQSFPASGIFPVSQFFTSGSQSIGASALILPKNIQGCFPLGLIGLISFQSKGLSKESSPAPYFKSINSLVLSFLYGPILTSIHDCWKNHGFDYISKVMSLLFNRLSLSKLFFQGASIF